VAWPTDRRRAGPNGPALRSPLRAVSTAGGECHQLGQVRVRGRQVCNAVVDRHSPRPGPPAQHGNTTLGTSPPAHAPAARE
jgi:hypothetical protein